MDDKSKEAGVIFIGNTALGVIALAAGTLGAAPAIAVATVAVVVGAAASTAIGALPAGNKNHSNSYDKR